MTRYIPRSLAVTSTLVLMFATGIASTQAPTWVKRTPTTQPGAGLTLAMAYHEADKLTYAYGVGSRTETWTFDGTDWKLVGTVGPRVYSHRRMAYDSKRNRLVLVTSSSGSPPFMTWEWDGTKWFDANPGGVKPLPGYGYEIAFDSRRGVTVMFGGAYAGWTRADTWEYDGATWVQRSSGGPGHRVQHSIAYDEARGEVIVFGGIGIRNSNDLYYGDTWVWNGQYWREHFGIASPSVRTHSRMTYDPGRKRVLLFGGSDPRRGQTFTDTWEWNGAKWALVPTTKAPPHVGAITFDVARGVAVQKVWSSRENETWEFLYQPPAQADFTPFGMGCPTSAGVPALAARPGQQPRIGGSFGLDVSNLPGSPFTRVMGLVGSSNTTWGGFSLPLRMGFVGMPGCELLVAHEFVPQSLPIQNGVAKWDFTIPNMPSLSGGKFYLQALVLVPNVNSFGAVLSNAGAGTLGY